MIKIIFNSFGRTFGRILCYLFISFILFAIIFSLKGEIQWQEFVEKFLLI